MGSTPNSGGATSAALLAARDAAKKTVVPPTVHFDRVFAFGRGFAQQWRLSNGLRIVLAPDATATVVAYHTWIAAGSADEKSKATGAAHLLEHLMFKATETQPAGAFDRMLESFGASANATTWLDWTAFHEVILPERVATVAALEADRLHRIRFDPKPVAAELAVVRNERSETVDDDPDAVLDEAMYLAAYGDTPYGHPTIGWDRDLQRLNADRAREFYQRHYAPNAVWLVLVGAIKPAEILPLLAKHYGALPAARVKTPIRRSAPLPKLGGPTQHITIDTEADRLLVGWRTVATNHVDHPALTVLAEVLANAASARITDALVHRTNLAAHVSAELPATRDAALFEIHIELLPGKSAQQAERALSPILRAIRGESGVSTAELSAARNRLLADHYGALASADGRADALGMFAATLGDPAAYTTWWSAVAAVSAADVQRVARTWLVPANRVVVHGLAAVDQGVATPQ